MRMHHFLLLGPLATAMPAVAADPAAAATPQDEKPSARTEARNDPASSLMASDQLQNRPAARNRVRYTFPPSTRRM